MWCSRWWWGLFYHTEEGREGGRGGEQRMEGERGGEGACVNLGHLLCISVAICLTASEAGPPSPSAGLFTWWGALSLPTTSSPAAAPGSPLHTATTQKPRLSTEADNHRPRRHTSEKGLNFIRQEEHTQTPRSDNRTDQITRDWEISAGRSVSL